MRLLLAILRPLRALTVIATELTALRELYEAELSARGEDPPRPIYRVTEQPSLKDTEVTYSGIDAETNKRWLREFAASIREDQSEAD